ncbi:hypothetical protein [Robertmurraya korlensis]|uniref:hypothetical protein n=1 Tax=Robertmurraya korlensis TaxID=519977 RepID=UPI000825A7DA|nr:hypothetical protein [Robertmurraya korlensis]
MVEYKKWFKALIIYTSLLLFSIFCFNYFVNPYNIFYVRKIHNFNEKKIENKEYLQKARDIVVLKPDVILLGTSRTQIGLDPNYYYKKTGDTAYNLGLSGANMYEQRLYFDYSLLVNPNLEKVIIGLDFEAFNEYRPNTATFTEDRLNSKLFKINDLLINLLTYQATRDSFKVISDNFYNESMYTFNTILKNGSHNEEAILSQHIELLDSGKNRFYDHLKEHLQSETVLKKYKLSRNRLNDLHYIINTSRSHNIELIIFIHPIHAIQLEGILKAGLWDEFEKWKNEVVELTPVWDFTGYNFITTSSPNNFNIYLDQSHYRKKVGNLIFDKILSYNENYSTEFGVILTNKNISSYLKTIRIDRNNWESDNQNIVDIINEL